MKPSHEPILTETSESYEPPHMGTWADFLKFAFPYHRIEPGSESQSIDITAYSPHRLELPPARSESMDVADAEDSNLPFRLPAYRRREDNLTLCLSDAFIRGVTLNGIPCPSLMIEAALRKIEKRLRVNEGVSEGDAMAAFDRILGPLVDDLVEYIYDACRRNGVVKRWTSHQGDSSMSSVAQPDDDDGGNDTSPVLAAEFMTSGDLRNQGGADGFRKYVYSETSRKMGNVDAMAIKMLSQMHSTSHRLHDFGVFAAGSLFIFCQSATGEYGTVLLTSPPVSLVRYTPAIPGDPLDSISPGPIIAYIVTILCQGLPAFHIHKNGPMAPLPLRVQTSEEGCLEPPDDGARQGIGGDWSFLRRRRLSRGDQGGDQRRSPRSGTDGGMQMAVLDDGSGLVVEAPGTWVALRYSFPGPCPLPRPVMRVSFTPSPKPSSSQITPPLSPPQLSALTSLALLTPSPNDSPLLTPPVTPIPPDATIKSTRSSDRTLKAIRAFLETPFQHGRLVSTENPFDRDDDGSCAPSPQFELDLYTHIGAGLTADVWRARVSGLEGVNEVVVKMIDSQHVASVARECMFYENVFPHLEGISAIVPEHYGTFASAAGGWYAIVLGDAGKEMEDTGGGRRWPADEALMESVRQAGHTLDEYGIVHGDWRPPNVLVGPDGRVRIVDFGFSTLKA